MNSTKLILWVLTAIVTVQFLLAGGFKLAGAEQLVQQFNAFGYPIWTLYLIGAIEVACALLVLTPRFASWACMPLVVLMVGAVGTHLATGVGSPTAAMGALVLVAILAWLRWPDAMRLTG